MNNHLAVIFDMDGVIIDSNPLITKSWKRFFKSHDILLNDEQLKNYVFGRTSKDTINLVFEQEIEESTMRSYQAEVEGNVQNLYKTEGVIIEGFKTFVESLIKNNISIAIATAAPPENVAVVLDISETSAYFNIISDSSHVHQSKPHPEIYLKTAERLGIDPAYCCVFEDSFSGISSAKNAGMKVIGVSTTHSKTELSMIADTVVKDFTTISIDSIRKIIHPNN